MSFARPGVATRVFPRGVGLSRAPLHAQTYPLSGRMSGNKMTSRIES